MAGGAVRFRLAVALGAAVLASLGNGSAGGGAALAQAPAAPQAGSPASAQPAPSLADFIKETLGQLGVAAGTTLPGLSDAESLALSGLRRLADGTAVASVTLRGAAFDIVRFTPAGGQAPLLVLRAPKLDLATLVPQAAETPLAAMGALEGVTFIYAGASAPKTFPAPPAPADGTAVPPVISDLQALARTNLALRPGMTFAAALPLGGLAQELAGVVRAVGLNPATKLPLRGSISTQIFKEALSTAPTVAAARLGSASQIKTALANLARTYGKDFLDTLKLDATIPSTQAIGPFTVSGERFMVAGDGKGGLSYGVAAAELKAYDVDIKDALFTYDAEKRATVAEGTVDLASLAKVLTFKGLTFEQASLASTHQQTGWAFALAGTAKLNGAEITLAVDSERVSAAETRVKATLASAKGITAKDVLGRDLPGFDKVSLTKVEVSGDRLVADMTFGTRKTPGELAAFHVGTQTAATLAFTLDKVAFADLVPGAAGSAMEGVQVSGLSLVVVPQGGAGLKPDDAAIPAGIAANLKKVLTDAAANDPGRAGLAMAEGFNLFANLEIGAAQGTGDLMKSAGLTQTVIPIVGTISAATFQPGVPKADSLKGLDLSVALPDLRLPGLPDTFVFTKPVFAVSEKAPAALAVAQGAAAGPYVTIGAGLQMKAGKGTHEFAALLMTGKDAQGRRVVDLVGSAKDPKDLFEFKGLEVKTLDLASVYAAGGWAFKLSGSATLNAAALTFATDVTKVDGKTQYVATLSGGPNGISAKDVAGRDLPGFDKVALTKVTVTGDSLVADLVFGAKKIPAELAAFHPAGADKAVMAVTLDKLAFGDLVPGSVGSALDGVEVAGMSLVVVPQGGDGLKPDDPAVPAHITANLKKVLADAAKNDAGKATYTLKSGFNLLADLDIKAAGAMGDLMRSAGLTETVLPVVGTISAATFQPNVPKADSLKDLDLSVALPDLKVPGLPDTIAITKPMFAIAEAQPAALTAAASGIAKGTLQAPYVTIGAGLQMKAGKGTHEFAALLMTGKDAQGRRVVNLVGSAKDPKDLFEFKGLEAKSLDLASVYAAGAWDFKLSGTAALNAAQISFDTEIRKVDGKTAYVATLSGGTKGISAKDVAGRDLPGFDSVALTKVTVTGDSLVADLVFGAKKIPAELAAFHVGTQTAATLAFTLDKLAFGDLVPGSVGSALDGVSVAGMSLVVVPQGGDGLKHDDAAIPAHIRANVAKVLTDAAKNDPAKATYALKAGFNLLADLDIKASGGMGDLMKSAGLSETVLPVVGTISAATFQPSVPKADSIKGLDLSVALPDLKVPGLPDTIVITKPMFAIAEVQPAALTAAASGIAKGALQAPFVTIGAGLQMKAGKGTHEFAAVLMTSKDAKGQRVVDLVGSAKDPKDLFEFKGLAVKTLDLASVYAAGAWDFRLSGTADLNAAQVSFDTEIRKVDGKTAYVATLSGGAKGISAKDVAGRDLPGFDTVALTKVTVTGDSLVADLVFGAKKIPAELAAFHPAGADKAVMAMTIDTLAFGDLVPGSVGSALDGVSVAGMSLLVVPDANAGLKHDDAAIPAHIRANVAKVLADAAKNDPAKATYALKAGFNLLADLDIKAAGAMGDLMKSAGLTETILPVVGTVSAATFKPSAPKTDGLKDLDLTLALPDLKVPGLPDTIKITKPVLAITADAPAALTTAARGVIQGDLQAPFVTIGAGLQMQAGKGTHEFAALLMTGKDAKGKRVVDLVGSAKDPKDLFEFKGLAVKSLDLASVYDGGAWDFRLGGSADLNSAAVTFDTEIKKVDGKTTYVATLSGGTKGISAKDVAGRDVPGFDTVALTKVTVTGDSLVADLVFGAKKTAGEIAAFHPAGADKAVIAMTLDRLAFGDLLPEAAGSPLDGVEADDLLIMVVPEKSAGLKPDDATIPAHIRANMAKVLADAGRDKTFTLAKDVNLLAALQIGGSTAMQDLMSFIGRDGKKPVPVIGAMSPQMFNPKAPKVQRISGMNLTVPMPNLSLAGLPKAFALKNTEFVIADKSPKGTEGLWVGLRSDMDADLLGSKIAFKTDVGFSKGAVSLSASSEEELKKPFGIKWLDLKKLAIALDYDKQTKSGDLLFTSIPANPFGKSTPEIEIDLKEEGGKLTAGVLKIKDKVAFSDLPILDKVKHADQFSFTFLEISESGVSGGSELHGQKVDAVAFEKNAKWVFAVSDNGGGKGFKFDRLIPALSKTPLKDFHLNDAALIFSELDIFGKVSDLPAVAQVVFKDIYGSTTAPVSVKNGITVAANFSPGGSGGFAAKGLKGIGIHDDILVEGAIINIFGTGAPGVDILVQTAQGPGGGKGATHSPKMAKFPGQVGFFIQYQADALDVGLEADVFLTVPKKQVLELRTKLELELNEKGFAVDIFMDLAGQWKDPFGIKGLELDEVAIKFGIDMEGEAIFGFHGKTILAEGVEKIDIAAEMDFALEASGLPDGVAIKGSISDMGIPVVIAVAEKLAGGKAKIVTSKDIPLPEFKDVAFAFATPGVSDPQLGLIGSGFMLAGKMNFLGRELGLVKVSAGTSGINMNAKIDPIDFKVVRLEKNTMLLDMGFTALPKLSITSEIEFLGAKQDIVANFDKGMMNMTFEDKIGGGIWDSKITLGLGVDAAHSAEPDVFVEGIVKSDFFAWLKNQAPAKVREFFNKLNSDFESAKAAINHAEDTVRGWNNQIAARKEAIQRERANADAALAQARSRVNSVKSDVDYMHDQAEYHKHKCHWYSAWHCAEEAYYWGRYGVEYAAYEVALGVLRAAQAVVDHLPSELMDPQLAFLEGKQAAAMAALELAKGAIDGVEDADRWIASGLSSLLADIGKTEALVIKEIFFEADLASMTKGEPAILTMDLEIFGDDLGTQMFAFKVTDPAYDAEQLVFIPLHMTAELFQKYLPKAFSKLLGPILTEINNQARAAEQKVYDELKNLPGLNLPPELKSALQSASLEDRAKAWSHASVEQRRAWNEGMWRYEQRRLGLPADGVMLASNGHAGALFDAGGVLLAQAATPTAPAPANDNLLQLPKLKLKRDPNASLQEKMKAFQEKKQNLLLHSMARNKKFGDSVVTYQSAQLAARKKNENDEFVAYTDVHVPPGELFTERLLVARHSKLCLGQNAQGKTTFHPCSENPGGLLWSTKKVLVDKAGKLMPFDEGFARKWPNRVYAQLVHNGACLTTPFHLADYDPASKKAHQDKLAAVASKHPTHEDAHLSLSPCRPDGKGQLWKVVKDAHNPNGPHGFKLQERDSAYCLRPGKVKANTKQTNKEVNGVFYPCTGIAHGTFELTVPNNDMPIWYDHNGVIKSDNGFCLDVPEELTAAANDKGSVVYLKACTDDEYDRWDYVVEYDKKMKIVNDFTGYCLYPYDQAEGAIANAQAGQLVQRPCDARHGQNWAMRIIPNQKWFQLEALDKDRKGTNTCMIADKRDPKATRVNVFVKPCDPSTRGRWEFGHWKGTYQWVEWTRENATGGGVEDLSSTYWVSADSLKQNQIIGVCRVVIGNQSTGPHVVYAGTWRGTQCGYLANGRIQNFNPSQPSSGDTIVEVLTGLDIGVTGATASWRSSTGGVPTDPKGQNATPPAPTFSAFLVGGDTQHPATYLCRVRGSDGWHYGYQATGTGCLTDAGPNQRTDMQVLVFTTVKNQDTSN